MDIRYQHFFLTIFQIGNAYEGEAAHIHYNVQGADYPEYWLIALWFSDDPRVNDAYKKSVK
ncbi:MAG: hypothetical protein HKN53_11700 [Maribacter sp.]|nr:hypothetical protein [Maribacter sp.]